MMKSVKLLKASILLVSVSVFILSCKSDELSRSTAEKLIKENLQLPKIESKSFTIYEFGQSNPKFKDLAAEGYLTYTVIPNSFDWQPPNYPGWRAKLTEKGMQYAVSKVYKGNENLREEKIDMKVATLEFGEITGIVERKEYNMAEVNFTVRRTNISPFGRIAFNLSEATLNKKTVFTKYDDGWRINK